MERAPGFDRSQLYSNEGWPIREIGFGAVVSRLGQRNIAAPSAHRKAITPWRDDGSLDGVDFKRDILPKLQSLPVRVIAEAMGASISHSSKVRIGRLIPHRHWKTLIATCLLA